MSQKIKNVVTPKKSPNKEGSSFDSFVKSYTPSKSTVVEDNYVEKSPDSVISLGEENKPTGQINLVGNVSQVAFGREPNSPPSEKRIVTSVNDAKAVLNGRPSKTNTYSNSEDFNPNFNKDEFILRIKKFFTLETVDHFISLKNKKLKSFIDETYKTVFNSPSVKLDLSTFKAVISNIRSFKDIENIENSAIMDSILDKVTFESKLNRKQVDEILENSRRMNPSSNNLNIPTKAAKNYISTDSGLENSSDDLEEMESIKVSKQFKRLFIDSDSVEYEPLPDEFKDRIALEDTSANLCDSNTFNFCKKFKCNRFKFYPCASTCSNLRKDGGVTRFASVSFVVSCSSLNKEDCPQSKIYSEEEQSFYDSMLEANCSEDYAHSAILNLRFKKLSGKKDG